MNQPNYELGVNSEVGDKYFWERGGDGGEFITCSKDILYSSLVPLFSEVSVL